MFSIVFYDNDKNKIASFKWGENSFERRYYPTKSEFGAAALESIKWIIEKAYRRGYWEYSKENQKPFSHELVIENAEGGLNDLKVVLAPMETTGSYKKTTGKVNGDPEEIPPT